MRPQRLVITCLVISMLGAGCGGSDKDADAKGSSAPAQPSATSASPTPSYDSAQLKSALIPAKDVASSARSQPITIQALKKRAAASCADSAIAFRGKPQIVTRQFGPPRNRYTDPNFAQVVAVFDSADSAAEAFASIKSKVTACPGKRHVPAKKLPGNLVSLAYNDTWKHSEDAIQGWTHLRGLEKATYPASTSTLNVIYLVHDYVMRGNVVIASVYFQRVKPKASSDPIVKRATELLTKQLEKIG